MPLEEGSKISEEDLPLWIGDSKIRTDDSKENLKTWEKTHCFVKLKYEYKVFYKGLYTMGQNTKRPNTTKGPIKPKQKHYKNYKKESIFYDLKPIQDHFKGHRHDSINYFEIPMMVPNHASIIGFRLEKIQPRLLTLYYLQPNTQT